MRKTFGILVCLLAMLSVGCGKAETSADTTATTGSAPATANPMVGSWKLEPTEAMKKEMGDKIPTATAEFKDDNTFVMTMTQGERTDSISGKYTLADKTLTLTPEAEDGKPSNDKPETVTLSDDMKSFPTPGASDMGKMVKQ
jgi:hypothetical protein